MFGFGKGKERNEFLSDSSVAILHLYADAVQIDGRSLDEFPHMKGEYGEYLVKLSSGTHTILGTYSTTNLSKKFKTKPQESEIPFEAGHVYSLGIYEYSRAMMEAGKDDPKFQHVYYLPLEAAGIEFGIICFIDK